MTEQNKQTEQQDGAPEVGTKDSMALVLAEKRQEIRVAAHLSPEDWPDERIKVIANIVAPKETTQQELAAFLGVCDRYKLDPIVGEIWLVWEKKKGKHLIMTGRDSYLAIADRHPDYEGFIHGTVREGDGFEIIREGAEVTVNHILGTDRGQRISAYCICYRKGRKPVLISRDWSSYKYLQGKTNWLNAPDTMLETRTITEAHRLQFRIPGLYTPEEIPEAGGETSAADRARDAIAGTRSRMDEMKARFRGEEQAGEATAEVETIEAEVVEDIEDQTVAFGQFKGKTWAEVFKDPKGAGYVKHWILEKEYEHPSLTDAVREDLRHLVVEFEQSREEETPQEAPEEAIEGPETPEDTEPSPEDPQASNGDLEALDELWHQGQETAAQLAKTDNLKPEEADELDLLREEGDLKALRKLVEKLQARLAAKPEERGDPELGF